MLPPLPLPPKVRLPAPSSLRRISRRALLSERSRSLRRLALEDWDGAERDPNIAGGGCLGSRGRPSSVMRVPAIRGPAAARFRSSSFHQRRTMYGEVGKRLVRATDWHEQKSRPQRLCPSNLLPQRMASSECAERCAACMNQLPLSSKHVSRGAPFCLNVELNSVAHVYVDTTKESQAHNNPRLTSSGDASQSTRCRIPIPLPSRCQKYSPGDAFGRTQMGDGGG